MKKSLPYLFMFLLLPSLSYAADAPKTEEEKTMYAVGLTVSNSLAVFDLSAAELEMVLLGIKEGATGKNAPVDAAAYSAKIQELARSRRQARGEKQIQAGKEFLEKAAKEKGAVKTGSGIVFLPLAHGKGESPAATDTVKVNYRGTLIDGREFDSTYKRGKPLEFRLDNVIKCWTEGLQKMKPGGKAKLVCPPEMAYGSNGVGDMILPGATLQFEVELLDVKKGNAPQHPAARPDLESSNQKQSLVSSASAGREPKARP